MGSSAHNIIAGKITPADPKPGDTHEGTDGPTTGSRTPPDPVPPPGPAGKGGHDLDQPAYLLNRELTWLNFNFRVLHEAEDQRTPLLERVKFLAIVSSNIDEFFMKRIGGLKQQVGAGIDSRTIDGRTPQEQIDEANDLIRQLEERKRKALKQVLAALETKGIFIRNFEDLLEEDQEYLREYYVDNIFPLVTPQATDPAHPFPFVSNLSLNLLVSLRYPQDSTDSLARVKVPVGTGIPRFLKVKDGYTFVPLENVMANNLDLLFPGMEILNCEPFRLTRNANTEMDEEKAEDLLALIQTELRERHFAPIVRLEVVPSITPAHRARLAAELGLDQHADVFDVRGMMALRDLMELAAINRTDLHYEPHYPSDHPALKDTDDIFRVIREQGPLLVHHPYVSFSSSVETLLKQASRDPAVRAIKMTLYRTSEDSKAISYLIDAARNGKQVAVCLELKARFDEEANIRWAAHLERRGVHVNYGVIGLKTHCKAILVVRQEFNALRRYAHIGTGNYHSGTARLYTDLGLLTCDEQVGRDLTELFNYLTTGYKPRRKYVKVLPAPKRLKQALLAKIEREIEKHSPADPGNIQFKMNALEDGEVTKALYRAAEAGVKIDLMVRDTCRLRPGIRGLSESVTVVSVVGRFLEHSRIFHFRNGGEHEYYIGSADIMKRNLDSRVEVLAPVEDPQLQRDLQLFLDMTFKDNRHAWEMQPDGSYVQRHPAEGGKERDSQQQQIEWATKRLKEATRLKRRRPRGPGFRSEPPTNGREN